MLAKNGATSAEGGDGKRSPERAAASLANPVGAQRRRWTEILCSALRLEWLGQTAASLFWISSVFCYGLESAGDYLQIFAAFAWLLANIAALFVRGDHGSARGAAASSA